MSNPTSTMDSVSREIKRPRSQLELNIQPGGSKLYIQKLEFPLTFEAGDVLDFNTQFFAILDDLRREVQTKGLSLSAARCEEYLTRLRRSGRAAFTKVIPTEAARYIAELEARQQQLKRQLTVTITSPATLSLLWELLYSGTPGGQIDAYQFWGFRYPLGRVYWNINVSDSIAIQSGVFSAIHDQLRHSPVEVEHLAEQIVQLCQTLGLQLGMRRLEQWMEDNPRTVEQLVEWFQSDTFRYGIVHFACHCENVQDAAASQSYLRFTARQQKLDLSLEELMAYKDQGFANQPLVFLNACESGTLGHLLQTISFPSEFLGFGAGGVIATACIMPDNFAAAFSAEFYRRLLDQQKLQADSVDIGEALLETRLHFLHAHNNPLGLGYNLYANSYQRLWVIS